MKISLIGYMGSGKSTVGLELSKRLGLFFMDLDQFIENENHASISSLFTSLGEIKFRKLEKDSLQRILALKGNYVFSMGGGTPVYYDNMETINQFSHSVYLRLSPFDLAQRLIPEKQSRPLIARIHEDEMTEFIAKHLFERSCFYNQAHQIIDVGQKSVEDVANEIMAQLPHLQK